MKKPRTVREMFLDGTLTEPIVRLESVRPVSFLMAPWIRSAYIAVEDGFIYSASAMDGDKPKREAEMHWHAAEAECEA